MAEKKFTDSGIEIRECYYPKDVEGIPSEEPGIFPYTRGVQPDM
ncbi:MAG: methylmalonyl-CoA mutase family protein, partial [Chitinophagaceae bacterium]